MKDLPVILYSQIGEGSSRGEYNTYKNVINNRGHFIFNNAIFSKPGNSDHLDVMSSFYEFTNSDEVGAMINGNEIKFRSESSFTINLN